MNISCSETFIFKSRCKFCKSGPRYIYYYLTKLVSTNSIYKIKQFYEDINPTIKADDFYTELSIKNRNFRPSFMFDSNSASLRKLPVPNMKYQQNEDKVGTIMECDCGKTTWAFIKSNRQHIKNRKLRILF
jgi:hypothetical protein